MLWQFIGWSSLLLRLLIGLFKGADRQLVASSIYNFTLGNKIKKQCMFAKYSTFVLAMATHLFLSQLAFAQSDWTLARDSDGIKIDVRNIDGAALREFRGEVQVRVKPEDAYKVLRDSTVLQKWMPDIVVSELLKSSDTEQFRYLERKAPWPLSNRDGIYHFSYSQGANKSIIIKVEAVPNYLPLHEGKVRIPEANGQWILTPSGDGVSIIYQMRASPGGSIPNWLANQAAVDTPFQTLKALRSYLQGSR